MELTTMELAVITVIRKNMDIYADGFSDAMVEDIVLQTTLSVNQVKGVLGSLDKKGLINFQDVNGEYNVYSLRKAGFDAIGYKPDYYDEVFM
ncbi:MAG: hypothetical protein ABS939_15355 [Psychrobacillus sp.]